MLDVTLYAWERPLSQDSVPVVSNIDHSWVTTYPEKIDPVKQPDPPNGWQPDKFYWYCWGAPHSIASHSLGFAEANLNAANNISPPNVVAIGPGSNHYSPSSNSGAIIYYGLDGVCHNVANQVLCATGTASLEPIRVQEVRGYPLSTFFYGTYGLNTQTWNNILHKAMPAIKSVGDDFLPIMKQHVPADLHSQLLQIRSLAQTDITALRVKVVENDFDFYPDLALITIPALYEVHKLLGDYIFYLLFPSLNIDDESWFKPFF